MDQQLPQTPPNSTITQPQQQSIFTKTENAFDQFFEKIPKEVADEYKKLFLGIQTQLEEYKTTQKTIMLDIESLKTLPSIFDEKIKSEVDKAHDEIKKELLSSEKEVVKTVLKEAAQEQLKETKEAVQEELTKDLKNIKEDSITDLEDIKRHLIPIGIVTVLLCLWRYTH